MDNCHIPLVLDNCFRIGSELERTRGIILINYGAFRRGISQPLMPESRSPQIQIRESEETKMEIRNDPDVQIVRHVRI